MRIGKKTKKIKSPERRATKAIPVSIPAFVPQEAPKEPAKIENFQYNWRFYYGLSVAKIEPIVTVSS